VKSGREASILFTVLTLIGILCRVFSDLQLCFLPVFTLIMLHTKFMLKAAATGRAGYV